MWWHVAFCSALCNVVCGLTYIVGGASGQFVMPGADGTRFAYVGIGLIVVGIMQIVGVFRKDDNDK